MTHARAQLPLPYVGNRTAGTAACRVCRGTGWEIVEFRATNLARRCRCRAERTEKFWAESVGIPLRYSRVEWSESLKDERLPAGARHKLQSYLRRFPETPGTLFVVADQSSTSVEVGVGLLKEIHRNRKRSVRYFDCCRELCVDELGTSAAAGGGARLLDPEAVDVLLLDHFFDRDLSAAQRNECCRLLHARYLAERHTIIACDSQISKAVRAALRGTGSPFSEEEIRLLRNLSNDCMWCGCRPSLSGGVASKLVRPPWEVA